MQRTLSLEQVYEAPLLTNERIKTFQRISDKSKPNRKSRNANTDNFATRYCIVIKPKLHKSSSLSDLTSYCSDINVDFSKNPKYLSLNYEGSNFLDCAGDADSLLYSQLRSTCPHMSWDRIKKKVPQKQIVASLDYMNPHEINDYNNIYNTKVATQIDTNMSCGEYSSVFSGAHSSNQKATFPFKSTPSGNLKVQSNQVVFQSSTVGVLLADPTQAKVKVKFEGKGESDKDTEFTQNYDDEKYAHIENLAKELQNQNVQCNKPFTNCKQYKQMSPSMREDKGKDLHSLGYALSEPIDWMRVQLPKKQDLYQEFYRRIHNFINTDIVVHITDEMFNCHRIVLQIYSSYFDNHSGNDIELPADRVSPETFHTVYEWMIFSGADSPKVLKRDNILDVFCAAQFLSIKDLEEQCWSFIVSENLFNEDTAFALFRQARVKGITPVMELMVPRVMRFFLPLVASTDFLHLEAEEIIIFLRSNYICVSSEIEILMAAVRWLYGDWQSRRKYCIDVMRCIRFGLISPWQLVDIKRNPDNEEILEIVNDPEVQQMVDDGLAYVIIKYWYGNNSNNYYHWIDVLGLSEPAERNWLGEEKNHVTYKDFLKYLEQFMVSKEQLYQQMSVLPQPRRNEEIPGGFRGDSDKMELRRPKMEFPLPAVLKGLSGDKNKSFPTMSEFFERRNMKLPISPPPSPHLNRAVIEETTANECKRNITEHQQKYTESKTVTPSTTKKQFFNEAERDTSVEEYGTKRTNISESSSEVSASPEPRYTNIYRNQDERHSVAACYLATATAALGDVKNPQGRLGGQKVDDSSNIMVNHQIHTPQISLFNTSKESLFRINIGKLSNSVLGPSNKNYVADTSLFNWDRETVLVFGGTDPHTPYGEGKNVGKDIYRFDPITNVWDYVGDLPEPRHHHSVAFLRGRVYLVGGADPRDDDIRGKSVVVSTVWSYEPVRRAWYSESGLAVPRKDFGLVVHRMALYAIGGQDKKGRVLRSVEKFDPKTSTWSEISSMSVGRMGVAATKYREYIWVAGGMTGERKKPLCRVVECYNSKTNEWTEIHNLRFPRCFSTLFAMNDKLYLIGGAGRVSDKEKSTSSLGVIDVWHWKERQWKQLTEMSIPRHGHALAYLGTQLIIIEVTHLGSLSAATGLPPVLFKMDNWQKVDAPMSLVTLQGGVTTIYMRALNNVESYCCERGAWIRGVAGLPSPLSGHGAVTLPPASLM